MQAIQLGCELMDEALFKVEYSSAPVSISGKGERQSLGLCR
jgi:hypothetical protein